MEYKTIKLPANATIGVLSYWASTKAEIEQVINYIEGLGIGLACIESGPCDTEGYLAYFEYMG
jgi:hypothetical protein